MLCCAAMTAQFFLVIPVLYTLMITLCNTRSRKQVDSLTSPGPGPSTPLYPDAPPLPNTPTQYRSISHSSLNLPPFLPWSLAPLHDTTQRHTQVSKPALGEAHPRRVLATCTLDLSRHSSSSSDVCREWQGLRDGEVVFLVSVYGSATTTTTAAAAAAGQRDKEKEKEKERDLASWLQDESSGPLFAATYGE